MTNKVLLIGENSVINMGGFIRDRGFDVRIADNYDGGDYLAVGFSVIVGDSTKRALELTRKIKAPVIWGGKLTSLAPDKCLEHADYIVQGDGEIALLNLLNSLKDGVIRDIPGVNCVPPMETHLDELYTSNDFGWSLVGKREHYSLYTSRGCKFSCSFCYLTGSYRRRSTENIIREINYLYRHGVNEIAFLDDNFLIDVSELVPVFKFIRQKKMSIWRLQSHISHLTPDVIRMLEGVCQSVTYSIETVSPDLQKIIGKRIDPNRIVEVNKELKEAGIYTTHNIIFGIPGETEKDTEANITLLKKLKEINPLVRVAAFILSPIPGTAIFNKYSNVNWDLTDLANFNFRAMGNKFRPYLKDNNHYELVAEQVNKEFN